MVSPVYCHNSVFELCNGKKKNPEIAQKENNQPENPNNEHTWWLRLSLYLCLIPFLNLISWVKLFLHHYQINTWYDDCKKKNRFLLWKRILMKWSDYSGVSEYFGDDRESVNFKVSWQNAELQKYSHWLHDEWLTSQRFNKPRCSL